MTLRRQPPPVHEPCECEKLRADLAEREADLAAMARAIIVLRPRRACDSIEQGLVGWGIAERDAVRLGEAARRP